jgi:chemotaxis protein CheD
LKPQERDIPVVFLKAGEMHITAQPKLVVTLLGSCLSITMFNRRTKLGGICHSILPRCERRTQCVEDCQEAFKYVDCSILKMVRLFERHKVKRNEIEVKCFGGSKMFSRHSQVPGSISIGNQNIQTAKRIILSEGLSILAIDVGGLQGRKIFFYTDTGEVYLKRLLKAESSDIISSQYADLPRGFVP